MIPPNLLDPKAPSPHLTGVKGDRGDPGPPGRAGVPGRRVSNNLEDLNIIKAIQHNQACFSYILNARRLNADAL